MWSRNGGFMVQVEHAVGGPIVIRYDGLDADAHTIELSALADSLKGLSRIVGVSANFAATQRHMQRPEAFSIRVVAAPPEPHCYEILVWLQWVNQNALPTTIVGGFTVALVSYVFHRAAGKRAEMKELRGALDEAIRTLGNRDDKVVNRLLDTVDKMADSLRPSAKLAVRPIGRTAGTLTVSSPSIEKSGTTLTIAERDAIEARADTEIGSESEWVVVLHELNLDTGGCRVSLEDDPEGRVGATITDPVLQAPNNPYSVAFAAQTPIAVKAKPSLIDGQMERLYISNTAD